jgi:hypothetical protein
MLVSIKKILVFSLATVVAATAAIIAYNHRPLQARDLILNATTNVVCTEGGCSHFQWWVTRGRLAWENPTIPITTKDNDGDTDAPIRASTATIWAV